MEQYEIQRQASLCRISLTEDEQKRYTEQIQNVLKWEREMSKIKQEKPKNKAFCLFTFNEDNTIENNNVTSNGQIENGYFSVPKVIE